MISVKGMFAPSRSFLISRDRWSLIVRKINCPGEWEELMDIDYNLRIFDILHLQNNIVYISKISRNWCAPFHKMRDRNHKIFLRCFMQLHIQLSSGWIVTLAHPNENSSLRIVVINYFIEKLPSIFKDLIPSRSRKN